MKTKIFTFNFDVGLARQLRDAVNEKQNLSMDKEHDIIDTKAKKLVPYFAWDRICTIMDRVEDTLSYMNLIKLGECISRRSAFDFFDFINNAYIIIEGIKTIGQIFALDIKKLEQIEKSKQCFGDVFGVGGTDGQFFSYIRSLCSVHPFNTTRHDIYMQGSKLHCCPFVVWSSSSFGFLYNDKRDLSLHLYTSQKDEPTQTIPLYIRQFEGYVNRWLKLIPEIISAIQNYNTSVYEEFRQQKLKDPDNFNSEIEYVFYLKEEYRKRFGDSIDYVFDKAALVLDAKLTSNENTDKFEKYKNAIRYALPFLHRSLQEMRSDEFEYTGIHGDNYTETYLLIDLVNPHVNTKELSKYNYNLSKVYYLENEHYSVYDKKWARLLLEEMKEFINKYVVFTNEESDKEIAVLVDLMLYLYALEQNLKSIKTFLTTCCIEKN